MAVHSFAQGKKAKLNRILPILIEARSWLATSQTSNKRRQRNESHQVNTSKRPTEAISDVVFVAFSCADLWTPAYLGYEAAEVTMYILIDWIWEAS